MSWNVEILVICASEWSKRHIGTDDLVALLSLQFSEVYCTVIPDCLFVDVEKFPSDAEISHSICSLGNTEMIGLACVLGDTEMSSADCSNGELEILNLDGGVKMVSAPDCFFRGDEMLDLECFLGDAKMLGSDCSFGEIKMLDPDCNVEMLSPFN